MVGFSNDILMEFPMTSVEVLFGSSVGVSLTSRGSRWCSEVLFVLSELRRFLVVFACGGVFHFFPVISKTFLSSPFIGRWHGTWDGVTWL